jgi:hypothetical protein
LLDEIYQLEQEDAKRLIKQQHLDALQAHYKEQVRKLNEQRLQKLKNMTSDCEIEVDKRVENLKKENAQKEASIQGDVKKKKETLLKAIAEADTQLQHIEAEKTAAIAAAELRATQLVDAVNTRKALAQTTSNAAIKVMNEAMKTARETADADVKKLRTIIENQYNSKKKEQKKHYKSLLQTQHAELVSDVKDVEAGKPMKSQRSAGSAEALSSGGGGSSMSSKAATASQSEQALSDTSADTFEAEGGDADTMELDTADGGVAREAARQNALEGDNIVQVNTSAAYISQQAIDDAKAAGIKEAVARPHANCLVVNCEKTDALVHCCTCMRSIHLSHGEEEGVEVMTLERDSTVYFDCNMHDLVLPVAIRTSMANAATDFDM